MYSSSDEEVPECPLCLEELDPTDMAFKPCSCGYQVCRFCWNHINENLKPRCPACRKPYEASEYTFEPPNPEEIARQKRRRKEVGLMCILAACMVCIVTACMAWRKVFLFLSFTHTHTHTYTHQHTLSLINTHTLSLSHLLFFLCCFPSSHSLLFSRSLSSPPRTHIHTHSLNLNLTLTLSITLSLCVSVFSPVTAKEQESAAESERVGGVQRQHTRQQRPRQCAVHVKYDRHTWSRW
jgi:RING/Ubox like zinc-binding domain